MARRVGLLTGTFDPVHLGHMELAKAAMRECGLDEVWLLVNPAPGHKQGVTDYSDRVAMANLAVLDEPAIRVYAGELAEESHTMATFRELMGHYSENEFVFVVGADVLEQISRWEDAQSVVSGATFLAARRAGVQEADKALNVRWFDFDGHSDVSSMKIRDALASGRPEGLADSVYEYILARGLYGE